MRVFVLANCAMFFVFNVAGDPRIARAAWRLVIGGSLLNNMSHIGAVLGWPRRDVAYGARLFSRFEFSRVLLCGLLLFSAPVPPALVVVVIIEPVRVADQLRVSAPPLSRLFSAVNAPVTRALFGDQPAERVLMTWCPYVEIFVGFLLLLQMLTPAPQPFACFFFWMVMQVRHMVEAASARMGGPAAEERHVRDAWAALDRRAEGLIGGVPGLGYLYRTVRNFFKRQVRLPEKGEKAGLRCAVM